MNAQSQVTRKGFTPSRAVLALLAAAALCSTPAVRADVRVGLDVGFALPHGYAEVRVGHDHYYTHRGVWYARGPHGYYVTRAPRGAIVHVLPPYYTRIYVGSTLYYRYGDVYYQPVRDGYVVVDAPPAEAVPPPRSNDGYQSVWVGQDEYLFKDGQFFRKTPDGTVWVQAPLGAIAKDVPPDAKSVWFQGTEYFESDDVYFRKTPQGYEVVTAPWKK